MNKLIFPMLAAAALFSSCIKDNDDKNQNNKDLITPEIANMAVSSSASFSGALTVLPCVDNTSTYFGNYTSSGVLFPVNGNYVIIDGQVSKTPTPIRLPAGQYNFIYWGVPLNNPSDPTYDDVAVREPPLITGSDFSKVYYSLHGGGAVDSTYRPVYDFVFARQSIHVGVDKMEATLQRVVAGLKVKLTSHGGTTMDPSIASAKVLIGSIAFQLNYYTAEPSDFTKTISFPLTMSSDSLSMSANSTVMVFPSGDAPLLTIVLTLKNGQEKTYSKPLSAPLTAGDRLNLDITLGELIVEEGSSNGFEVENWTETTETIDFPS